MGDLRMQGLPIIAFEIGAGQMEFVDEEGVTTGPIVGLTLVDRDQDRYVFALHPQGAIDLAPLLDRAGRSSLTMYFPKEAAKERWHLRLAVGMLALFFCVFGAFNGWSAATTTTPASPTVFNGVAAGVESLFMLLGMTVTMHGAMTWHRRRQGKKMAIPYTPRGD